MMGAFQIRDVPAGAYTLRAWHETMGAIDQRITVSNNTETELTIRFPHGTGQTLPLVAKVQTPPNPLLLEAVAPPTSSAHAAEVMTALKEEKRATIIRRGRDLYSRHCAPCHGDKGDGRGDQSSYCETRPRDFTRGEYKFRSTPSGSLARVDDLMHTISFGLQGTDMPAWSATLTQEQIRVLAEYLTSFSLRYSREDPPPPIAIPPESTNDAASIARGKLLYQRLQCAQCHGRSGLGDGVSNSIATRIGPKAPDLSLGRFKRGSGAITVYRAMATGLSGSAMPSFSSFASPTELWDLAHFVVSMRRSRGLVDYLFRDPVNRRSQP
jgi:cytochrome c oxidase cbb3-type subunit 2